MENTEQKMLLLAIITSLVDKADEVKVNESLDDRGILLEVHVAEADMGKIIGKGGELARAIRSIMRAYGYKNKKLISIKIVEPVK